MYWTESREHLSDGLEDVRGPQFIGPGAWRGAVGVALRTECGPGEARRSTPTRPPGANNLLLHNFQFLALPFHFYLERQHLVSACDVAHGRAWKLRRWAPGFALRTKIWSGSEITRCNGGLLFIVGDREVGEAVRPSSDLLSSMIHWGSIKARMCV
jgi:hypothetical protein